MKDARFEKSENMDREFIIRNELGLHARAASALASLAAKFKSDVLLKKDGVEVNGKSIMGILMLAAPKGSVVVVSVSGIDAREAIDEIGALIERGFGEK